MTVKQYEKELLKLDARSRAKLAQTLLLSLEELSEEENERLWVEEALLRHQQLTRGNAKGRSANLVIKEVRARLK